MSDFATIQRYIPTGNPNVALAQHGSDASLYVVFSTEPKLMGFKSEKAGRPIYEDRDYISMTYVGGTVNKREVRLDQDNGGPSDPERFPRQWAAFKAQAEQAQSGTPLEVLPWLKKSQIYELKAIHIHTAEQLANVPDSALSIPGMREIRTKTQQYLAAADDGAAMSALEAKNKDLETDLEMLKEQVRLLSMNAAKAQAETETPKRGPGRPRKEEGNDNAEI